MKSYTLENGLTLITDKIDFFQTFSLGFWVRVGSVYEDKKTNGYTHFIEHMLFKGTKERNYFEISYDIEKLGGYINAFTSKEQTCFYVNLLDKYQETGVNVLWDMLNNSTIQDKELEKEKLVVIDEIRLAQDDPEELIYDLFIKQFWKDNSQGYPILGNIENIRSIKREDIIDFLNVYYKPDNFVISITGSFKEDSLLKQIEKLNQQSYWKKTHKRQYNNKKARQRSIEINKLHYEKSNLEQCYAILAFKTPSRHSKQKQALFILNNILGEGSSSRLFVELREKSGLCYSIYSFCNVNEYDGVLGVNFSTGYEKYDHAISCIFKEIEHLIKNGITMNELIKAKEQLKSNILFAYENLESRMHINTKNELYYKHLIKIEDMISDLNKVTLGEVNKIAREILTLSSYTLVNLGSKKSLVKK